ncbi:cellulose binding domain-containing protein [Streptomyces acidiscabies]|uniref:cellulose binding domain-containing protein n=1 Tax=Streptomyces acidiscabies TaxID=42234 RepID=UPI001F48693A|nr:cellulose binding domain-containing protein [Streptomyces acidiscabies]
MAAAAQPPVASAAATEVLGNATHFDGLGNPYGGCGLPQRELDSQDFVALNVFDTPGDYSGSYPRPVPDSSAPIKGAFDNGRNCGRWVKVTIGDYCSGTNDGAPGQPFCRNGSWSFVPAPDYSGDIRIGFLRGAQQYWPAIAVSHLPNGVHGIQYLANGTWTDATMNSDMGQPYVIGATASGGSDFTIRIRDAADAWLGGGRTYSFSLPSGCAGGCSQDYTAVPYTTDTSGGTPPPTPAPSPSGDTACTAQWKLTGSWQGGYQADVTVTNTGSRPVTGWSVHHTLPGGVTVANRWNAVVDPSRPATTVHNASYNGDDRDLGTLLCTTS